MTRYTFFLLILTSFVMSGCVRNDPWRTGAIGVHEPPVENVTVYTPDHGPEKCRRENACAKALVEVFQDLQGRELFEIGYIEFTERGNLFDTQRADFVMDRIADYSRDDRGVITIVFIHGWKHNASIEDDNVQNFRKTLQWFVGDERSVGNKRVVGVYIGWRGASVSAAGLKEITFWDRKAVAQKVGKGGVTDILLDLEEYDSTDPENILVVVGHSFGGAILLSAYSEQVLSRVKYLAANDALPGDLPIADSLVLINPAIEANEMLPIKEAVIKHVPWSPDTPNLMRVVSTRADGATHRLFPLGQYLGTVLTWNQEQLYRESYAPYEEDSPAAKFLHERTLDMATVGNFLPYHTQEMVPGDESADTWEFIDLCDGDGRQLKKRGDRNAPTFPCSAKDPVQFVYTPKQFMNGHNDIFNDRVNAYVISTVRGAVLDSGTDEKGMRMIRSSNATFESDFQEVFKGLQEAE